MLVKKLVHYRDYCESQHDAASRLLSMFRPRFDYPAKINAINKVLLDMDNVTVQYTSRDIDVLNGGKLAKMLRDHHEQLPAGLKGYMAKEALVMMKVEI